MWNRLCFAPSAIVRQLRSLHLDRFATYIACTSSQQLARAIRRLQGTKFELVCCLVPDFCSTDTSYWGELEPAWFEHQCRAMSLLVEGSLNNFPHLFHKMGALEELVVSEMNTSYSSFLHELEVSSPRLHTLELQGGFPFSISHNKVLLGRLKNLSIEVSFRSSFCLGNILHASNSLEKLHWDGTARNEYDHRLVPSSISLNFILLTNSGLSVFPAVTYARVVDLDIKFTNKKSWPFNEGGLEFTMPALKTLTLEGRWSALKSIRASGVTRLVLRRSTETMKDRLDALRTTSITPEILRLDRCIAESELISVLRSTWKDIKELHLSLSSRNDHVRRELANALTEGSNGDPICPQLRAITVLLLRPETMHAGIIAKMSRLMAEIKAGRNVLGNVEVLRCGWVQWAGKLQEGGMESWPNQEWTDYV